jgi:hypothetical protein
MRIGDGASMASCKLAVIRRLQLPRILARLNCRADGAFFKIFRFCTKLSRLVLRGPRDCLSPRCQWKNERWHRAAHLRPSLRCHDLGGGLHGHFHKASSVLTGVFRLFGRFASFTAGCCASTAPDAAMAASATMPARLANRRSGKGDNALIASDHVRRAYLGIEVHPVWTGHRL